MASGVSVTAPSPGPDIGRRGADTPKPWATRPILDAARHRCRVPGDPSSSLRSYADYFLRSQVDSDGRIGSRPSQLSH